MRWRMAIRPASNAPTSWRRSCALLGCVVGARDPELVRRRVSRRSRRWMRRSRWSLSLRARADLLIVPHATLTLPIVTARTPG